jgi:hypothetical protein
VGLPEEIEAVAVARTALDALGVGPGDPGDQRVCRAARGMQHAVACPDPVGTPVLPAQPRAAEHVEDLLLGGVGVARRRTSSGGQVDAVGAYRDRAGGAPQSAPRPAQLAHVGDGAFDLVPVGDHPTAMLVIPPA